MFSSNYEIIEVEASSELVSSIVGVGVPREGLVSS